MYCGDDFSPATPNEIRPYSFDFIKDIPVGAAIVSVEWTCAAVEGTDEDADSRPVGSPIFSGTITTQRVGGLQAGVKYLLVAEVTDDDDNVWSLESHVMCNAPG